ncbi:hypothetical protein [Psychromicrobium lacuslunae]|uniref:DNA modification methylase n=1 Tax=Psychromicrobium lacuslunae TaxID=1618207 RepID=A0A0D4C1Z3_9MICC|nr:hypothetical protein [Psychromicrobium lacuslunae]AJT42598.1 hypothetical protein UM93_15970 [Psychromicrobium lacuslunae]
MKLATSNRWTTRRRLAAASVIGASLLGITTLAGCGYIAPQQTTVVYSASDGVRHDLGNIELRNILLVSAGEDKPGRVIGAVFNTSKSPIRVTFNGASGSQTEFTVKPGEPYYLNQESDSSILSTVAQHAGSLETVKVSQNGPGTSSVELKIPVLDGTLAEYKPYLPDNGGNSGEASPSSSSSPSASPTSSPSGH